MYKIVFKSVAFERWNSIAPARRRFSVKETFSV